jgi:hypothetical protein
MLLPHRNARYRDEQCVARVLLAIEINQDAAGKVAFVSMAQSSAAALAHRRDIKRSFGKRSQQFGFWLC